ncbi:helix-turn-helix transcriptional regulator [Paenibacillus humicola]|uniref:helix-turn-helix transcriptional regulator n=1 Tax=Paenibacillus humicola TaxID=3110540 RepID=UPI00237C515A|nr:helix-turn-helix transcriptional regulator [Paenibacillus humicola]
MDKTTVIEMEAPPLPYYITTGHSVYMPGEQHPNRRSLGIFDLLWVMRGTLYIGEDDKQWEVSQGQTLLLLPDRYHYAAAPCRTETAFYWIHFDYHGKWSALDASASPSYPVRQTWANPYTLRLPQYAEPPQLAMAERHLRKMAANSGERRSAAYWSEQQLFMELLRLLEESLRGEGGGAPGAALAERTEAYLRQHYQSEVTNESLAEALHFHPNYIVRCMKEVYRCTPMEYLHEYRLEQAKLLLIKTEWPVAQIAEEVGFRYAPYFSSRFKQYAGMPPLRFRKQYSL